MILEMHIKHLQHFFSGVIDEFNLFDVVLSYRDSNDAMEGSKTDAAQPSCLGNKQPKLAYEALKNWTQTEFSLGEEEWEVLQQKANWGNITTLACDAGNIQKMWL